MTLSRVPRDRSDYLPPKPAPPTRSCAHGLSVGQCPCLPAIVLHLADTAGFVVFDRERAKHLHYTRCRVQRGCKTCAQDRANDRARLEKP